MSNELDIVKAQKLYLQKVCKWTEQQQKLVSTMISDNYVAMSELELPVPSGEITPPSEEDCAENMEDSKLMKTVSEQLDKVKSDIEKQMNEIKKTTSSVTVF